MKKTLVFLFLAGLAFGCKPQRHSANPEINSLGRVEPRLEEASGLVASITNPGMFWTVNDSGNPPEVFLIDRKAQTQLVCKLGRIRNRDWEDITVGDGPEPGKHYVYVADIGDNSAQYDYKYIYRFEEPVSGTAKEVNIDRFDTLILKLPDGKRDAETLMTDPQTHDMYLVSKREEEVGLYVAFWPFLKDTLEMRKLGNLPLTYIVAGSISPDGQEVLMKDYDKVYYWRRASGETILELLKRKPVELPYTREPQGEAIAWSLDGTEYFTLSEGSKESPGELFEYKKKK